jgi:metallo-beta-lactamase family protein
MKITCHGAARTVTGSKHLITLDNGTKILLDCGLFQGMGKQTEVLNSNFGFEPTDIDVMVLSHAHIDHCGLVPKLVKDGYKNKIWCTPATKDLAAILMQDSGGIQESDIKFINKKRANKDLPLLEPLYTEDDAKAAIPFLEPIDYNQWTTIHSGVELQFTDAGHIIGSASVHLRITENGHTKQLTFSGDVGRYRDAILCSPATFSQADYILIESTYGDKLHDEVAASPDSLLHWIKRTCIEKKGKLIIPAFSVGRTQELLYTLNQLELENRLPNIPYIVDSPLSSEATDVVKSHPENFNEKLQKILRADEDPFSFKGLKYTKTVDESKQLNFNKQPCVIISASGMADAGRVKHHISNNIENSRNTILLVGYCEPNSLGGRLKNRPAEVGIFGIPHEVHAEIAEMKSMSAHGDYNDLFTYLSCQNAANVKQLLLVHGEYEVQQEFKNKLHTQGFKNVLIPEQHVPITLV